MEIEEKQIDKKRSIGEVAKELGVETHVIRFWETKFPTKIKPEIGKGDRRYYFDKDLEILKKIKSFLYEEGYTITGLQKLLSKKRKNEEEKEHNLEFLTTLENQELKSGVNKAPELAIGLGDFIFDETVIFNSNVEVSKTISATDREIISESISAIEKKLDLFQKFLTEN